MVFVVLTMFLAYFYKVVMARGMVQSISKTETLVGCFYGQYLSKAGIQRQGHGQSWRERGGGVEAGTGSLNNKRLEKT